MKPETQHRVLVAAVWILRIAIGIVFISSGLAKTIDLWGTVYKIEEYFRVWGIFEPRSIVFMGSLLLSGTELVVGALLVFGCYRRVSVWILLAMMAVMLPLTVYIYAANPVSDCGCFGDLFHLSNAETFWKNVVITAALIFLLKYNRIVGPMYSPWLQWFVTALLVAYTLATGLYGYNIQPLVDFRSFPAGGEIIPEQDMAEAPEFVYEKDGKRQTFSIDNLPGEGWTYVDRIDKENGRQLTEMAVFDSDGEEVTSDVIPTEGNVVILVVPELGRAEISYTYFLNELNNRVAASGGKMLALVSGGSPGIAYWKDMSLAEYPVYSAEPTLLKELSRGNMSLVAVSDGIIQWKRNLITVDQENFLKRYNPEEPATGASLNGVSVFQAFTIILLLILGIVYMLDSTGRLIKWRLKHLDN